MERFFHPSKAVENKRKHAGSIAEFYITSLEEMKALLAYANRRFALAAEVSNPRSQQTLRSLAAVESRGR